MELAVRVHHGKREAERAVTTHQWWGLVVGEQKKRGGDNLMSKEGNSISFGPRNISIGYTVSNLQFDTES